MLAEAEPYERSAVDYSVASANGGATPPPPERTLDMSNKNRNDQANLDQHANAGQAANADASLRGHSKTAQTPEEQKKRQEEAKAKREKAEQEGREGKIPGQEERDAKRNDGIKDPNPIQ